MRRRDGDMKRMNGETAVGRKTFGLEPDDLSCLTRGPSNYGWTSRAPCKESPSARWSPRRYAHLP